LFFLNLNLKIYTISDQFIICMHMLYSLIIFVFFHSRVARESNSVPDRGYGKTITTIIIISRYVHYTKCKLSSLARPPFFYGVGVSLFKFKIGYTFNLITSSCRNDKQMRHYNYSQTVVKVSTL